MWRYDNSYKNNNSDKPIPLYITPREREAEKVLFTMWGNRSLESRSHKTIHYSAHRRSNSDESSEEEGMKVSLVEEIHGHRYLETSHSSSLNRGGRKSRRYKSQETIHSTSSNCVGCGRS